MECIGKGLASWFLSQLTGGIILVAAVDKRSFLTKFLSKINQKSYFSCRDTNQRIIVSKQMGHSHGRQQDIQQYGPYGCLQEGTYYLDKVGIFTNRFQKNEAIF